MSKKQLTPFHDKKDKLHFPFRPLRDIAFIFPSPPPETLGDEGKITIPEQFRKFHRDKTGTVLAIGSGYFDKKDRWNPVDPELKPGVKVYFDNTVPWAIEAVGQDGRTYVVTMCGESDILGIVEDEGK